jgi:hypothetical protein
LFDNGVILDHAVTTVTWCVSVVVEREWPSKEPVWAREKEKKTKKGVKQLLKKTQKMPPNPELGCHLNMSLHYLHPQASNCLGKDTTRTPRMSTSSSCRFW